MNIERVQISDINRLVPLFDAYRMFYGKASNQQECQSYLLERLTKNEAQVFLAVENGTAIGFTLLYPFFSSVNCARVVVLNDLFVIEGHRSKGVAQALIDAVKTYAISVASIRIELATEVSNTTAQRLYDKYGFKKDTDYYYYSLKV